MEARLRRDVEGLAALSRGSATPGERASGEWVAERLREAGAEGVRLEPYRSARTFAHAHALHFGAGLLAARLGSRALAATALASFELEYSGRSRWARRLLPASEGVNVSGRLPARGPRRRTVVLVAHHDAALAGLMWDRRLTAAGDRAATRSGRRSSLALLPELALAALALAPRRMGAPAAGILAVATALVLEQSRGKPVPGANDNASGVAGVLELVRRLRDERPEGTEVLVLSCGSEESGMGGMAAWLERTPLDPSRALVIGLDTIGSGEPVVLEAEGGIWPVRYRGVDVARGESAGLRRWRLGAWTDPVLARLAGLPAVSILSVRDGGFPNYHRPTDLPEHVDFRCAARCVDAALEIAASA